MPDELVDVNSLIKTDNTGLVDVQSLIAGAGPGVGAPMYSQEEPAAVLAHEDGKTQEAGQFESATDLVESAAKTTFENTIPLLEKEVSDIDSKIKSLTTDALGNQIPAGENNIEVLELANEKVKKEAQLTDMKERKNFSDPNYYPFYSTQGLAKKAVPKDAESFGKEFTAFMSSNTAFRDRDEFKNKNYEDLSEDQKRVVQYEWNKNYVAKEDLEGYLKSNNLTTDKGADRYIKSTAQGFIDGVSRSVGSSWAAIGEAGAYVPFDAVNELVLKAQVGAITRKEYEAGLAKIKADAANSPLKGMNVVGMGIQNPALFAPPGTADMISQQHTEDYKKRGEESYQKLLTFNMDYDTAAMSQSLPFYSESSEQFREASKNIQEWATVFNKNPYFKTKYGAAQSFLPNVLAPAGGTMAALVAAGLVSGPTGSMMLGAAQMAADGYEDALKSGGTPSAIISSYMINAGLGATDAIPIASFFGKTKLLSKVISNKRVAGGLSGGVVETLQETGQTIGSNLTAKNLYDANREVMTGVKDAAIAAFLLGASTDLMIGRHDNPETPADERKKLADNIKKNKERIEEIKKAGEEHKEGFAINMETGDIIPKQEQDLQKEQPVDMREQLDESVMETEPVDDRVAMKEIPEGSEVEYQGLIGKVSKEKDGYYVTNDDGVKVLIEGGENPDVTLEDIGVKPLPSLTQAAVRTATVARQRNYDQVEYDGEKYFVSLDDPNNPDGVGDKVFKYSPDGSLTEVHYARKANKSKKLAIINKAIDSVGMKPRVDSKPTVEEKQIIADRAEYENKEAPKKVAGAEPREPKIIRHQFEYEGKKYTAEINDDTATVQAVRNEKGRKVQKYNPDKQKNLEEAALNSFVSEPNIVQEEAPVSESRTEEKQSAEKQTLSQETGVNVEKNEQTATTKNDGEGKVEATDKGAEEKGTGDDVSEKTDTGADENVAKKTVNPKQSHNEKFENDLKILKTTENKTVKSDKMYERINKAEELGTISEQEADDQRQRVADVMLQDKKKKAEDTLESEPDIIRALRNLKLRKGGNDAFSSVIPVDPNAVKALINAGIDIAIRMIKMGLKIIDALKEMVKFLVDKGMSSEIAQMISQRVRAELKNPANGVYKPKNIRELEYTLKEVFNLSKREAKAAARLIDMMGDGYLQAEMVDSKEEFYEEYLPGIIKGEKLDMQNLSQEANKVVNAQIVNGFYSPIEKKILETRQEKFSAKKWMEILGKGDEAKYTGVYDMLAAKKPDEQVHRNEIMQWMKDNRIEIVEVVKGEVKKDFLSGVNIGGFEIKRNENGGYDTYKDGEMVDEDAASERSSISFIRQNYDLSNPDYEAFIKAYNEIRVEEESDKTKFSQYQLEGEKTGYVEILITLPTSKKSYVVKSSSVKPNTDFNKVYFESNSYEDALSWKNSHLQELGGDGVVIENENAKDTFKSSHFDEPNIIAHLRMNIRTDAEGNKTLFLEEIQSDWGQKGKKEGFVKKQNIKAKKNEDGLWDVFNEKGNIIDGDINVKTEQEAIDYVLKQDDTGIGIPVAPFVTDTNSWVKLALKFALQHAIKEGATKIAWTTGEQQNERYDLSKQVDEISYYVTKDGSYQLLIVDKSGNSHANELKENELEGFVGKELAQKIINGEGENNGTVYSFGEQRQNKTFKGVDLKIGGKGMIGFYGSPSEGKLGIVGNVAESLFGKGSVKTSEIIGGRKQTVVHPTADIVKRVGRKLAQSEKDLYLHKSGLLTYTIQEGKVYRLYDNKDISEANDVYELPVGYTEFIQHSISITPEIKKQVEDGLPLFQSEKAAYYPGKRIIQALTDPDVTSPIHETAHAFFDDILKHIILGNDKAGEIYNEFLEEANSEEGRKFWDKNFKGEFDLYDYTFQQEFFARGFEQYLKDGVDKPGRLGQFFEMIKNFFNDIYNNIVEGSLDINLSDRAKKMYDKVLGLNPEELDTRSAFENGAAESVVKRGSRLFNKVDNTISKLADLYKNIHGIKTSSGTKIYSINVENSKRIADAFDEMKDDPNNNEVKEAYTALAEETADQFDFLIKNGYQVEIFTGKGEPYANSADMLDDLSQNKHLFIFSTEQGFGKEGISDKQRNENPLLRDSGRIDKNGVKLLNNDLFRFVHDVFGHGDRGNSFGAVGEENAWDVHARMFSPKARRAMTTETRGQNSWVNFGKHMRNDDGSIKQQGDKGYLGVKDRPYADQKTGLLPEWVSELRKPEKLSQEKVDRPDSTFGLNNKDWNALLKDIATGLKGISNPSSTEINQAIDNATSKLTQANAREINTELKSILNDTDLITRSTFKELRGRINDMLAGARDEKVRMAEMRAALKDWVVQNRRAINASGIRLSSAIINRINNSKTPLNIQETIDYLNNLLIDADFKKMEQRRNKLITDLKYLLDPHRYIKKEHSIRRGKKVDPETIDMIVKLDDRMRNNDRGIAQVEIERLAEEIVLGRLDSTGNRNPLSVDEVAANQATMYELQFSGIEDATLQEVENLLAEAEYLIDHGKTQYDADKAAQKAQDEADVKKALDDITGGKPSPNDQNAPKPGRKQPGITQRFFTHEFNDLTSALDNISPGSEKGSMQSFLATRFGHQKDNVETKARVDLMNITKEINSKKREFFGATGLKFKRMVSSNAKRLHDITFTDTSGETRTVRLTMNQMAYDWGLSKNPGSRRNIKFGGVEAGQNYYDALDNQLPDYMKAYTEWLMDEFLPGMHPYINAVYKKLNGINLARVDNYLPQAVSDHEIENDSSWNMYEVFGLAGASPSSIKQRVDHGKSLRHLDIDQAVAQYVLQTTKYVNYAEMFRDMKKMFWNPKVATAIIDHHGKSIFDLIRGYISVIGDQKAYNTAYKLLDSVRKNVSFATLSAKIPLALYQISNSLMYLTQLPMSAQHKYFAGLASELTLWNGDTRSKIMDLVDSDYFKQRFGYGASWEITEQLLMGKGKLGAGKFGWRQFLMLPTISGDIIATIVGGYPVYKYHYDNAIKRGFSKDVAKATALEQWKRATDATQQSSFLTRASLEEARGSDLTKWFTMYMSQPRQINRLIWNSFMNMRQGRISPAKFAHTFIMAHMVMPMMIQFIANGLKWDWEDETRAGIIGNFNSLFVVGQLVEAAGNAFVGNKFYDANIPFVDWMNNIVVQTNKTIDDYEENGSSPAFNYDMIILSSQITGLFAPVPAGQIQNVVRAERDGSVNKPMRYAGWSSRIEKVGDNEQKAIEQSRLEAIKEKQEDAEKRGVEFDMDQYYWDEDTKYLRKVDDQEKNESWKDFAKIYKKKNNKAPKKSDFYWDGDQWVESGE